MSGISEETFFCHALKYLRLTSHSNLIPTLAMFATYVTYTVVMKKELNGLFLFFSRLFFEIFNKSVVL